MPLLILAYYVGVFTLDVYDFPYVDILYVVPVFFFAYSSERHILFGSLLGLGLIVLAAFMTGGAGAGGAGPDVGVLFTPTRISAALFILIGTWLAIAYRRKILAVRRSEAALREAHGLVELGHFQLDLHRPGDLICSDGCLDILGVDRLEVTGLRDLLARLVHKGDRARVLEQFTDAWRRAGRYDVECRIVLPTGELRDVRSVGQFHRNRSGRSARLTGTLLDVSAWRRAERFRSASEARMRSILDAVFDALIMVNRDGRIEAFSASAETLFGYHSDEIVGAPVEQLLVVREGDTFRLEIERLLNRAEPSSVASLGPIDAFRKDGSTLEVELAVSTVRFDDERHLTMFVRDLTESRRLEEELRQAQKMEAVGRFAGGIAHDFNNLLTIVIGNIDLLESRPRNDGDAALLREARETAELGASVTERLLSFSRRQRLEPRSIDLSVLLRDIVRMVRRPLGDGIHVELDAAADLRRVLLDPAQLQVALLNLVLNARDAMPDGGTLSLAACDVDVTADDLDHPGVPEGRFVLLAVTDDGTGMSEDVRRRALEPFFTTKETGRGTGLGLSMVYGFVTQSHGHVAIDSTEGEGTSVRLYLPCSRIGTGWRDISRPLPHAPFVPHAGSRPSPLAGAPFDGALPS